MLRTQDKERFDKIYDEYHRLVRNVIFNLAGAASLDDLVQESFLRIWKGLPRFGARSSMKTWVYRVAVNAAIDHLRKLPVRALHVPWEERHDRREATPSSEVAAVIQSALIEIDEEHRSVLVLHYFEDLSLEEVSGILEVPLGTVKSRLHNGRRKLEACLKEKGVGYE